MSRKTNNQDTDKEPVGENINDVVTEVEPQEDKCGENRCDANMSEEQPEQSDNSENLAEEVAMWKDRFVRLSAEFDNYRKRTLKEKMDLVATASEDVIKSMLPVLDDFDRAINVLENNGPSEAFAEGVMLIQNKLKDTLRAKGLNEVKALGEKLDTDLHDAVAKVPVGKKEQGKIVDVAQKGYTLNDKVIRHAKVIVGE